MATNASGSSLAEFICSKGSSSVGYRVEEEEEREQEEEEEPGSEHCTAARGGPLCAVMLAATSLCLTLYSCT